MPTHPNFLSEMHSEMPAPKGPAFWRLSPWVLIGVAVLLLIYVVLAALGAGRVVSASLGAKVAIARAQTAAEDLDFPAASGELDTAAQEIARAQKGLAILAPLRILPYVGDQVRAVGDVLDASGRLVPALQQAVAIAAEGVDVVGRAQALGEVPLDDSLTYLTLPADVRRDLLTRLHQSLPELQQIYARLKLAAEDVAKLDDLTLAAPIAKAVEPFTTLIPELTSAVEFLIPVAEVVPEFGGLDVQKRYLVLYENNTELRPGGGFVGNYIGSMTVENGAISEIDTEDSYAIDGEVVGLVKTPPPAPLQKYLGVSAWYFRDANWSPDFSLSATQALTLFNDEERLLGRTPTIYDGVIAVTPAFAADLLDLVGSVTIDGQTFTSDNIAAALEYQVESGFAEQGLPASQRKEIVDQLSEEVMHRLFSLPLAAWVDVSGAALQALAAKQLLLYSADADTQEALTRAGWGGVLTPPSVDEDSLLVVDANLASLKSDPAVARTIDYRLRQNDDGKLVAQVNVTYEHGGDFDWKTTRYRTYTRVYVPLGSQLIRGEGMLQNDKLLNPSLTPGTVDVTEELGFTTFGAFISIEPGATGTLSFSYYLPDVVAEAVKNGTYQLAIFKQAGAQNNTLTVDVDFGKPLLSAAPPEDPSAFGNTQYLLNTILDQDREVVVRF
mgnify:FL=1